MENLLEVMLYIFILFFQLIGIGFHVGQKVIEIDKRSETDTLKDVIGLFVRENIVSLCLSVLVLLADLMLHLALSHYTDIPENPISLPFVDVAIPFEVAAIFWSLFLGYAGQRVLYKALNKAEKIVEKKIEDK